MDLWDKDLEKYCRAALDFGVTDAKQVSPGSVVTAPWVRWKCRFGCPGYDKGYGCPPVSPTPEETRSMLDSYERALLFHLEEPARPEREERVGRISDQLVELEGVAFKDGYYKAFVLLYGPCMLCEKCGKTKGTPCARPMQARPSMEACGIDVFQTARRNGFSIRTLRTQEETRNLFALLLVD